MSANPFSSPDAAARYLAGRPDWGSYAAPVIRRVAGISEPAPSALDVACGTGISSRAFAPLARSVVGVDAGLPMLRLPEDRHPLGARVGARAEQLPFRDSCFDLIGAASALHWFDLLRFAREADRVATADATLLVLDHWFEGEMDGQPGFAGWMAGHRASHPSPPRDRTWRPSDDLGPWRHVAVEHYQHTIELSQEQMVDYLSSQSNLQVVVDRGEQTEAQVREWLWSELGPFFASRPRGRFGFGGYVACLRR